MEDLLAIRLRGEAYALRLAEITGLVTDLNVVPLPSPVAELLGIGGLRGATVAVYDLGTLLGYPRNGAPRWFVLADSGIGLAIDRFDGHLRLSRDMLAEGPGAFIHQVARTTDGVLPVVHIPSVLRTIEQRVRLCAREKER
jgi:chemotaxis signal transduction protein